MYVYVGICTYIYICMYKYTHTYMYSDAHIYIYIYICVCMGVCTHSYIYTHLAAEFPDPERLAASLQSDDMLPKSRRVTRGVARLLTLHPYQTCSRSERSFPKLQKAHKFRISCVQYTSRDSHAKRKQTRHVGVRCVWPSELTCHAHAVILKLMLFICGQHMSCFYLL